MIDRQARAETKAPVRIVNIFMIIRMCPKDALKGQLLLAQGNALG